MHGIGSAKSFVHIETVFQRYERRRRRGESEKFNLTCFASSVYGMVRLVGVQSAVRQRRRTHAHARESRRRRRRIQGEDKANRNVQRNDLSRYENDLAWNEFVPYSLLLFLSPPFLCQRFEESRWNTHVSRANELAFAVAPRETSHGSRSSGE